MLIIIIYTEKVESQFVNKTKTNFTNNRNYENKNTGFK